MGADEVGTLAALKAYRHEIVDPAITAHKGRIVKTTGDGILVEFASAVDAVTCAVVVQEKMADQPPKGGSRLGSMRNSSMQNLARTFGQISLMPIDRIS